MKNNKLHLIFEKMMKSGWEGYSDISLWGNYLQEHITLLNAYLYCKYNNKEITKDIENGLENAIGFITDFVEATKEFVNEN
jgi:hypothetical protein